MSEKKSQIIINFNKEKKEVSSIKTNKNVLALLKKQIKKNILNTNNYWCIFLDLEMKLVGYIELELQSLYNLDTKELVKTVLNINYSKLIFVLNNKTHEQQPSY